MVRPRQLVESVLYVLQNESDLPEVTSFVGYEPDINSESIKLPLVQVSMGPMLEIDESNSDFLGFQKDADGNDVGRIYETLYTQDLEVSVWTAHGSKHSPRELSDSVRDTLYPYTSYGPDQTLPHPDVGDLDEVWFVETTEGNHTDDLGTSPSLRRWQQIVEINASERYIVDAGASTPPIEQVTTELEYDGDVDTTEETFTVQ